MYHERMAFDSGSQRTKDKNGYLRVAVSHITKESVNPYYGYDIPGARERGLDLGKIYMGYREGSELARAAPSFNGLPLLLGHYEDSAENPQKSHRVGSLGTDAVYNAPYLDNSLIVTDAEAIKAIESGEAREISAAYRYTPEWTKGVFNGQKYDFVMRDIVGNHVALVKEGRAGHDVVVADAMPDNLKKERGEMSEHIAEPLDMLLKAVKLVKRGKDVDAVAEKIFDGVDEENIAAIKKILSIAADKGVNEEKAEDEEDDVMTPKQKYLKKKGLATDDESIKAFDAGREFARNEEDIEEDEDDIDVEEPIEDEDEGVETLDGTPAKKKDLELDEDDIEPTEDEDEEDEFADDEDEEDEFADDEDEEDDIKDNPAFKAGYDYEKSKGEKKKPVLDEDDVKKIAEDAALKYRKKAAGLINAADRVRGTVQIKNPLAFDSASDIYKRALKTLGVNLKGVHPSAYRAMYDYALSVKPVRASGGKRAAFAMDAKDDDMKAIFAGLKSARRAD